MQQSTLAIGKVGREKAKSIISCSNETKDIYNSIKKIYSKSFSDSLSKKINPHGKGFVSKKIIKKILETDVKKIIKKKFYDYK